MKNIIQKMLFEPLIHFIILGMLLFLYFDYSSEVQKDNKHTITLSNYDVQELLEKDVYKKNSFLLDSLVQDKYYNTILLNEAVEKKLHVQNSTIKDKLITQMQFLIDGEMAEPSEALLQKYYEENKENYSVKKVISFYSLELSEIHTAEQKKIYRVLQQRTFSGFDENLNYHEMNIDEIKAKYGKYFTLRILGQKKATWLQIPNSKEGSYFIYIKGYEVEESYSFDEVIDRVYNDYQLERLQKKRDMFFKKMQAKYTLEVLDD